MAKYPSLGILDALFSMIYGFNIAPSKQGLYESLPAHWRDDRTHYSKALYKLEQKGYIRRSNDKISFTDVGEEKALLRSLKHIDPPKKRDGYSRLIAFDVPEQQRTARDILRKKLYEFQCIKVQKSLYMTPFVCEEELEKMAMILKLQKHLQIFVIARPHSPSNNDRQNREK